MFVFLIYKWAYKCNMSENYPGYNVTILNESTEHNITDFPRPFTKKKKLNKYLNRIEDEVYLQEIKS